VLAVPMNESVEPPILFFDGVCGLCNRFVDRVLRADRSGVLRFAPLQGETAARVLPPLGDDPESWSLVFLDEQGLHRRSDAALRLCRRLGGWWRWLGVLRFVPRAVRVGVFRWIARHRYRWFGQRESCRVPSETERARFLP
jgi:predicted DCC family thiol-disulfide oxidoreductase YuxK